MTSSGSRTSLLAEPGGRHDAVVDRRAHRVAAHLYRDGWVSFWPGSGKQVTIQVTTAPGNARPGGTSSEGTLGLVCANRTQGDAVRWNRAAWHAEGQGFESP